MTITEDIRKFLITNQDVDYQQLQIKTIPSVEPARIIGVRTPALRSYAKELSRRDDVGEFLQALPHELFEEDQLHAFILSGMKDYDACVNELEKFLPYVNNWATCDQMSPKIFKKHKSELLKHIKVWVKSRETYTIRYGVGMLMEHFLDEDFDLKYPEMVSKLRSDEYYVNMMIAWYFATALAKQYDAVIHYLEQNRLAVWTHNKAIQKSIESYRITPEQKEYLRSLKIKK